LFPNLLQIFALVVINYNIVAIDNAEDFLLKNIFKGHLFYFLNVLRALIAKF